MADFVWRFGYQKQIFFGQIGGAGFAAQNFKWLALAQEFFFFVGKKFIGAYGRVVVTAGSRFDVVLGKRSYFQNFRVIVYYFSGQNEQFFGGGIIYDFFLGSRIKSYRIIIISCNDAKFFGFIIHRRDKIIQPHFAGQRHGGVVV